MEGIGCESLLERERSFQGSFLLAYFELRHTFLLEKVHDL